MAADTFAEVPKYEDWAADEGPVCRRVVEVLRLDGIEEVASLVDEYLMAVHEFGKPGFFARAWKLRKYVGTRLDEKLCTMLPGARLIPYKLEAALRKFSDCGDDAFDANEGGIDLEELRTAFEELHQEEKVPLEETQLIRAIERFDEAAVRYADEKMSAVMAETTSLTVYAKGLVLRLLVAAFADDTKTIETIMEVAPNIVSCATHVAAMRGNTNAIMKLKDMKGDFTIPDGRHRTPLHHAAAHGHAKVVSYLLLHCQVNVDAKDHSDRTALMRASFEGFLDVVICLVDVGKADVNIGYGDEAAIDLALRRGHIEVVKYLETRGARRPSAPTYTSTASASPATTLLRRESARAGVRRTLRVRPHMMAEQRCDHTTTDVVMLATNGGETSGKRVDQPVTEAMDADVDNLLGARAPLSLGRSNSGAVDFLFNKTNRSLNFGAFDAGHLVRLATTGRPVFEVVDFIAQGRCGEVYAVRSTTRPATSFAMKRVRSDKLLGASRAVKKKCNIEEELQLCREALLMVELGTHPHIVSLHQCVVSNSDFLLFTTLVDGARNLETLVSSGDLYNADTGIVRASIFSMLKQLASALAFCHSRGVLHQDVKLENVLIDTAGRAYLSNFGLARHGNGVCARLRAPLEGWTPAYASPEVVAALDTSSSRAAGVIPSASPAETDIWAFGVVALHLYHADVEDFPEVRTVLESIVTLKAPEASWGRVEVDAWLLTHSLLTPPDMLDGAALFTLSPNNLHGALPWLNKRRDRTRLRRMLLAPPPSMSNLVQHCLADDMSQRPTCGTALLEMMQVPIVSTSHHPAVDVAETLLNIGRAVVELNDVDLECRALEAAAVNGGDVAECYSLIACAHLRAGGFKEALVACDRALSHNAEHGGALFAKAEAAYRHDSSDSLFVDVVCKARVHDPMLFAAPRAEKNDVAYLEAAKHEADSARDFVTNDPVSVFACVNELQPKLVHRRDVKTNFRSARPSLKADSSVQGALADVVHTGEGVEAAMRTGRIVIEGDAGSGKGWILRAFVVALCNKQLDNVGILGESSESGFVFPLTISLSSIDDPESDWIGCAIDSVRDGGDALRGARIDRRLVLCLDGLDEVMPTTRPLLLKKIVECSQCSALTVITSRPAAENIDHLAPHGFVFFSIAQVDRRRAESFGIPSHIASVVETPLALRLALVAMFSSTGKPLPILRNRSDLFLFADEWFVACAATPTRQDGALTLARDVLRESGNLEVRSVFEQLALAAHKDRRSVLDSGDFEELKPTRLGAAVWSLARSGLLPPLTPHSTTRSVAFFHLTFQEFYVARALGADRLLVDNSFDIGDQWWQSPALFAFQLAEERGRERALGALSLKIPNIRLGETVEVAGGESSAYTPHVVVSMKNCRVIGVKKFHPWSPRHVVSVERVRRDVVEAAALARRAAAEGDATFLAGLLDRGADLVTPVDPITKESALHAAARSGRTGCARLLVHAGAWSHASNAFGSKPLDFSRCSEMLRLFEPPKCDEDLAAHHPNEDDEEVYAFVHRRDVQCASRLAASVNVHRNIGTSLPLHFAVVDSCNAAVTMLLERGAQCDHHAFELASRFNRVDSLFFLEGSDFGDALHIACRFGFVECARLLIKKGAEVDATTDIGWTPLRLASQNGHVECMRFLIERGGADVDKANASTGTTPLQVASQNGHVECVRFLIEKGANVDKARTDNGATSLHAATQNGHIACVKILIAKGADVDKARTNDGLTPFLVASLNGYVDCVRFFIEKGGDVNNAATNTCLTPLHLASQNGHLECVRFLISKGADVTAKTTNHRTPRDVARSPQVRDILLDAEKKVSSSQRVEWMRLMLENDTATPSKRSTPLLLATQNGSVESVRLWIEQGAEVDKARTGDGATPLILASQNGHVECVQLLIDQGAEVDKARTGDGATPLILASQNGHVECGQLLIEKGAEVNKARTDDGSAPLHLASHNGHVECVDVLIEKGAEANKARTEDGATPLYMASQNGHVECVQLLIEKGTEVHKARTDDGATPLHVASQNGHVDCAQLLIEKGAEVDKTRNDDGSSPLHMASQNGHVECVQLLIKKGAEVDKAMTNNRSTALHMASQNGHVECAQLLIENGGEVENATNDGVTALHFASRNGHVECVRLFIEKGALVDSPMTTTGSTPLLKASQNGHVDCAQLLIEMGANVDNAANDGTIPLHVASQNGHVECVHLLIAQGADVNKATSDDGSTPLLLASQNGHVECVELLISNGAEIDSTISNTGSTSLHLASQNGHFACVRLLIEKGAEVDRTTTEFGATSLLLASQNDHIACARLLIEQGGAEVDRATTDFEATPILLASQNGHVKCVGLLIEKGAEVDKAMNDGTTPLHMASENGHIECVRILIEKGANVDAVTSDGTTPLDVASESGHVKCVRLLIENGARVDKAMTDDSTTPLHAASQNGHFKCVRLLIEKGAEVDKATIDGTTPLLVASQKGHIACVRHLIEKGAEVNNAMNDGATALLLAYQNGHVDCVQFLIEKGADIDEVQTDDGSTALHLASENGNVEWVRLLIELGAQVDKATTDNGATALHLASENGHVACVQLLIEKDAKVDKARTDVGASPLYMASQNGHVECAQVLIEMGADLDAATSDDGTTPVLQASQNGHVECLQLLVAKGADVNKARTDDGLTPLLWASWCGNLECVQLFIEKGADVNKATTDFGATPLLWASQNGHVECVRILIEKGAEVDKALTNVGSTPLLMASWKGHVECAKLLIEKGGAEVDKTRTDDGSAPLHLASKNGHVECLRLLIEKGAEVDKETTDDGSTPLHAACWNGRVECVKLLIENGAAIDKSRTDDTGTATPLLLASENRQVECVRLLLEKRAEIDKARTDDGSTPLHLACQNGDVECVRLLIENHAEVDKPKTSDGSSPLYVASRNGHVECVPLLIESGAQVDRERCNGATPLHAASWSGLVECVQLLIAHGAEVDKATSDDGSTPLSLASQNGHIECVRLLIEKGADVNNATSDDGTTPLLQASLFGHVECAQLLIEKGAEVNKVRTDDSSAPLHLASQNGHVDCVQLLIEKGAKVDNAGTNTGATPLHLASQNGHVNCVRLLIAKGADVKAKTNQRRTALEIAKTPQVRKLLLEAKAMSRAGCWCASKR